MTNLILSVSLLFNILLLGWVLHQRMISPPVPPRTMNATQPTVDPRVLRKLNISPTPTTIDTPTPTRPPRSANLLFTSSTLALAFHYPGEIEAHEEQGRVQLTYLAENHEDFDTKLFLASMGKTVNTLRESSTDYAKRIVCESQSPYIDRVQHCLDSLQKTTRHYRLSRLGVSGIQFEYNPGELPVQYIFFEKNGAMYDVTISGGQAGSPVPEYGKKTINTIFSTIQFL